jgi:hypothetical protein
MTHEENEELQNQLSKLDNQINELNDRLVKKVDLMNTQIKIEIKLDEKMEQLEQKIEGKLEQMEQKILETLNGRLPEIDKVYEGSQENKGSIHVEQLSNNNNFPGGFNSNSGITYGWSPKGVNLPKVELRKFDGEEVFTWVNQIERYFELHNIMDSNQRIHIATLNFEIKLYQWYQWLVKRNPHSYHYT